MRAETLWEQLTANQIWLQELGKEIKKKPQKRNDCKNQRGSKMTITPDTKSNAWQEAKEYWGSLNRQKNKDS